MNDRAIILIAFGTIPKDRGTYSFFESRLRKRYPQEEIFWASSKRLPRKMTKHVVSWESPEQVMKKLKKAGYQRFVLQPLHMVPGIEYEKLMNIAKRSNLNIAVGMPLLSNEIDCHRVLNALSVNIPDSRECITVLVGQGTAHSGAGSLYMLFEQCVQSSYPENVYISMIEGVPSWEATYKKIKKGIIKKIKFIPLMFVADEHIIHHVLGNHDKAWKNQLKGYEIDGTEKGLGFNKKIIEIWGDHLKDAMEKV